jgi:hypothetical protein
MDDSIIFDMTDNSRMAIRVDAIEAVREADKSVTKIILFGSDNFPYFVNGEFEVILRKVRNAQRRQRHENKFTRFHRQALPRHTKLQDAAANDRGKSVSAPGTKRRVSP